MPSVRALLPGARHPREKSMNMDQITHLIAEYWSLAPAVCTVAAMITASVPRPASGWGRTAWAFLNVLALNIGYAKNAPPTAESLIETAAKAFVAGAQSSPPSTEKTP